VLEISKLQTSQNPKVHGCLSDGLLSRVSATGLVVVLINLGEEICECYRHAEDCGRKATAQVDPKLKQDFFGPGATLALLSPELRIHATSHRVLRRDDAASG